MNEFIRGVANVDQQISFNQERAMLNLPKHFARQILDIEVK
jgi:hypothetical protein